METGPNPPSSPENKEKFSLRNFLTYNNPNAELYRRLIKQEHDVPGRRWLPQAFSEQWRHVYYGPRGYESQESALKTYFREKLNGGILIDIGGGQNDAMADLAKISGVETYINVDESLRGEYDLSKTIPGNYDYQRIPEEERARPMTDILVKADALDFVSRVPSDTVCFAVNGMDFYVLEDADYRRALMGELIRTTKPGGILFGASSDIWRPDPSLRSVEDEELGLISGWGSEKIIFEIISP